MSLLTKLLALLHLLRIVFAEGHISPSFLLEESKGIVADRIYFSVVGDSFICTNLELWMPLITGIGLWTEPGSQGTIKPWHDKGRVRQSRTRLGGAVAWEAIQ